MYIEQFPNTCTVVEICEIPDTKSAKSFYSTFVDMIDECAQEYDAHSGDPWYFGGGVAFVACLTQNNKFSHTHLGDIGFSPLLFPKNDHSRHKDTGDVTMWYIHRNQLREWYNAKLAETDSKGKPLYRGSVWNEDNTFGEQSDDDEDY